MAKLESSYRIKLSDERKLKIKNSLQYLYENDFDESLSDFRAEELISFFTKSLGAVVYNQAINDACAFMQEKVQELDEEYYEPE